MSGVAVFPPEASLQAGRVDRIFFWELALSVGIIALVAGLMLVFSVRYRAGSSASRKPLPKLLEHEVEIGWTAATLFLFLFLYWFATGLQLGRLKPPPNAIEIHVVGKQWMWKLEHPNGLRELNALHVPAGVPVRLVMTSQDVIHDFWVPAFRIKQDVLPGRYVQMWFTPSRPGRYALHCSEFCGLDHSLMNGVVTVLSPADYGRWEAAQPQPDDLAGQGRALFDRLGCASCHGPHAPGRLAPNLEGLFGRRVLLSDGRTVVADEGYLRDSIVLPEKDVVAGYPPIMPSFARAVDEEDLVSLVAYLKSLGAPPSKGDPP